MVKYILDIDRQIVVGINSLHSDFWDNLMIIISDKYTYFPLYLLLIIYLFARKEAYFKVGGSIASATNSWKISLAIICAILLTFALTDQISHSIIKPIVQRLRPSYDIYISNLLHLPDGKGGLYGFVSNHSSNFWGLTAITSLLIRRKTYTAVAIIISLLVCYSRIYLGRHFMGDIVGGFILGAACGIFSYYLTNLWYAFHNRHLHRSLS